MKSFKIGTKIAWRSYHNKGIEHCIQTAYGIQVFVSTGIVAGHSRKGDNIVIIEWDNKNENFPVTLENVDDLVKID